MKKLSSFRSRVSGKSRGKLVHEVRGAYKGKEKEITLNGEKKIAPGLLFWLWPTIGV